MNSNTNPNEEKFISYMIKRLKAKNPKDPCDNRPCSYFVGQDAIGFITDPNTGELYRVTAEMLSEVGPASYTPEKIAPHRRSVDFAKSSKRPDFIKKIGNPGPGRYSLNSHDTKLFHQIQSSAPMKMPSTFLSGNMEHEEWSLPPKYIPKNRFPRTNFKTDQKSLAFSSVRPRVLFTPQEPGPETPAPPRKFDDENQHQEREEIPPTDRFEFPISSAPPPTAYNPKKISNHIPSASFDRTFERYKSDIDPPVQTPGPCDYFTKETQNDFDNPTPVFASMVPRDQTNKFESPAPTAYNIPDPKKHSISIHQKVGRKQDRWDYIPAVDNPAVGQYNIPTKEHIVGGYVGTKVADSPNIPPSGEYCLPHSTLLKKTYNSNYPQPQDN